MDDVNSSANQVSSNNQNDNVNVKIIQELPKNITLPAVEIPSVIQPLATSSNSSPLPNIPSLSISSLLPLDSNIPNDFSFINTISNISSTPSDRPVHHTYVSSVKSQVRKKYYYN